MLYRRLIINGTEYMLAVSQSGSGAPAEDTVGSVGVLYMDTDDGSLYKCTGVADGKYTWEPLGSSNGTGQDGQDGEDGEDGGYYTPAVTQPTDDTMEVAFTPSKADMPSVAPVTVKLPGSGSSQGASGGSGIWYGTTSTGENTAEKVVTTVTGDFKLVKGARLGVKFLTNTVNCNSLIVDGTARTYIRSSNDEAGNADSSAPIVWHNLGQVQWFTYDGEYFILDDSIRATAANSLCGKVAVSDSVSSTGNTVASSTAVKTAYDKAVEALDAVSDLDKAIASAIGSGVVS